MYKKKFKFDYIIYFFLTINILLFFFGLFKGFSKPFWIDEIHAIGFSQKIPQLNLKEIFSENIHSPFYFVLLTLFHQLLDFFNLNEHTDLFYLRLINLIGVIPLYVSFNILKKSFTDINLKIVFLLLISSYFFFHYSLDLKMYFLLLCFSFLINVLNLINTVESKHKFLFITSSSILSLLHVFGLAISMSILCYRFFLNFLNKDYKKCKIDIYFSVFLLFLFLITFYLATLDENNLKSIGWIKIQLWYFRVFIEWSLNTIIFILLAIISILYSYKSEIFNLKKIQLFLNSDFLKNLLNLSIPSIILVIVTLLISLKIPVLNYRNLIVIFPTGVLVGGLLSFYFLRLNKFKILLIFYFLSLTFINSNSYLQGMSKSHENIEWVIKNTYTKECENAIIYLNDENKVFWDKMVNHAINVYSDYYRPLKRLTKFNKDEYLKDYYKYKNCKTFISTFHYRNFETYVDEINSFGFDFKIKYAPNVINEEPSKAGAITVINRD